LIAVLGGVGAAVAFSATTLCYARLSRMLPPLVVLAWVMIVGLAITLPLVAIAGAPHSVGTSDVGWLLLAGFGNVAGLILTYMALRHGKVALVAPITSTEGAIAALISVVAGEKLAAAAAVTLAVIVTGILLASTGHDHPIERGGSSGLRTIVLAVLSAGAFGASLYAVGRVGRELPLAWALLPARAVGVAVVATPLALSSRLRLHRPAVPFVLAGGSCEVVGIASYTIGARHGIAVSAVLASQFGAVAALIGFFLFRERLTRVQVLGVAAIAVGVTVLSGLQG
jgi:drug/metabolite transporter (DMT)-like permease